MPLCGDDVRTRGEDDLLRVTGRFYEAAAQPELWRTVLHETSELLGADGAAILGFPNSSVGAFWSEGIDELADRFLNEGWHSNNSRAARAMRLRSRKRVATESDLFTPEELERLPFNAELINKLGFRWATGAILGELMGATLVFSAERLARRERFDRTETAIVEALAPHLLRAAQLAFHLGDARGDGMLTAFEQTGTAAVLIDYTGRIVRMNRQAEQHQGSAFCIAGGQLMAKERSCDAGLQRVIGYALAGPCHAVAPPPAAALTRAQGRPLAVIGLPIAGAARDIFQQAKVILLLIDPEQRRTAPETILQQVFRLTPAEARLAVAISSGLELKGIAEMRRVSLGTARAQLKSLMAKTDTHRQGELVALLSRLAAVPSQIGAGSSSPADLVKAARPRRAASRLE